MHDDDRLQHAEPQGASARLSLRRLRSPLAGPFSFELGPGECIAITGASGSGKSLLLRMIADLDVSEGEVVLDGRARAAMPAPQWRRSVTYVPAEAGWWADTVAEHFERPQLGPAKALMGRLGLADALIESPVARLSTGERQRIALIRALVLDPPVLLLDEPTGALDPASVERVEALLRERLAAGGSIVMVTHDAGLAARLGSVRYRMSDRKLAPA